MKTYNKIFNSKILYIFFIILSLNIFFFSTTDLKAKPFNIENIEISKPFELNFEKNKVINNGFRKAFNELILLIVKSTDQDKFKTIKLNEIKSMINSFSIKEEKFVNDVYFVNLGVSFDKKKIFEYLEKKNIFPLIPKNKKFLFVPIMIDEKKQELLIFSENKIFSQWNNNLKSHHLIEYILPAEDLEDIRILKDKYEFIEQYDFKEITNKYDLKESIIALIFKNNNDLRILSRITIKDEVKLKNQLFKNININDDIQIKDVINELKMNYEDFWKDSNMINTSIRLILTIKMNNLDNTKISKFERNLSNEDLVYDYKISKFNKDYTFYKIIFNGTPSEFLNSMKEYNYRFDTQNKIWSLDE